MVSRSVLLVRGMIGIVVGLLAMLWPGLSVVFLVGLFGAYAFVDGVVNIAVGLGQSRAGETRWATYVQGLVGVAVGVATFLSPGIATLALLLWIAVWAVVTGILEIASAIRLRRVIEGEWKLALSGTLSVLLGAALFAFPALGIIGLAWAVGAYAAVSGVLLIALAVGLGKHPVAA